MPKTNFNDQKIFALLPESWDSLMRDIDVECERAMKQRDNFLATGEVTSGHGGGWDTCFGHVLKQHLHTLNVDDKTKINLLKDFIQRAEKSDGSNIYYAKGVANALSDAQKQCLLLMFDEPVSINLVPSDTIEELLDLNLAVKVCFKRENNYVTVTNFAYTIAKEIMENLKSVNVTVVNRWVD